jgi:dephospho-CoA kinase
MAANSQQTRINQLVVGITGRMGSGKTSAAKHLASEYGFQYLRYSQVLSDWRFEGGSNKSQLQESGWEVMANGLQEELNRRLIQRVLADHDVAVDGLRHPIDFECLKNTFSGSFRLVYIDSTLLERWARLRNNGRYSTFESFELADAHPVEDHIGGLRAVASVTLDNHSSLEALYASTDGAIRAFREEDRR